MARQEALVTPEVMRWAREQAGLDIATAAQKIGRPEADIEGWEQGTMRPSMPQARKASEVYKRSLAVFYLPDPPKDFQALRDFRQLPTDEPRQFSSELAFLLRRLQSNQAWLHDWRKDGGQESLDFVGSASVNMRPRKLADRIRKTLELTPDEQMARQSRREVLNLWIERTEQAGICLCRQGRIEVEEVRGIALTDDFAPFIYLNTSDALAAQLFTLAHELVHLWINQPGISNLERLGKRGRSEDANIEIFCNTVAAYLLIEPQTFKAAWSDSEAAGGLAERIDAVSQRIGVSEEAVARRLLDRDYISVSTYRTLRRQYHERWKRLKDEERERSRQKEGGPSYYRLRLLSNSRPFTKTVLSGYFAGQVMSRDASSLLGVKVKHLPRLADEAGLILKGRRSEGAA